MAAVRMVFKAIEMGDLVTIRSLIENNEVDVNDDDGWLKDTLVHYSCKFDRFDILQLLLSAGAIVDQGNEMGDTPLHYSSAKGNVIITSLLLDYGASINAQNENGDTPLHRACHGGELELVTLLLERGADVNIPARLGVTPLLDACSAGKEDIALLLLQNGAIPTPRIDGLSPLHHICMMGSLRLAQRLLDYQEVDLQQLAQVDFVDPILHLACGSLNVDLVEYLLVKGANIDGQNQKGDSALHIVAEKGMMSMIQLLVDRGADVTQKNKDGFSSLDLAKRNGHDEASRLLTFSSSL